MFIFLKDSKIIQMKEGHPMKKRIPLLLICALLCGCLATQPEETVPPATQQSITPQTDREISYTSRFDGQTYIELSDAGIKVSGEQETTVTLTHDIIYYEDRDAYESGNPYGEGGKADKHTADEAAAHTVVNITEPGAYLLTGKLSTGQIRIDLGEDAYDDPNAVVELILQDADITCTVAPAILFLNVYECDGNWSEDTAKADVDTTAAGANLILRGENTVSGSYVAKIYKDKDGEKKLWKQDGAIYSYMSMNVFGPGKLTLFSQNEGLDSELHLTVCGGDIAIYAQNDGINTNEDGVSVTTIRGGSLHIIAGLGAEGDGIDSNGYLVIRGGTVVSSAHPAADAGLDSDLGSYVHGGTVIALGSTMDWAESESGQVTMNLQFAQNQSSGSSVVIVNQEGSVVFAYDPAMDEVLGEHRRQYMGAVISCPNFHVGQSYTVHIGSTVTGTETGGVYDVTTVTAFAGGIQMAYTGSDLPKGPGGFGDGRPPQDQRPEGGPGGKTPEFPDGMPEFPEGERPEFSGEGMSGFPGGEMPGGGAPEEPSGQFPGGFGGGARPDDATGEANTQFYLFDKVNAFSGIIPVT